VTEKQVSGPVTVLEEFGDESSDYEELAEEIVVRGSHQSVEYAKSVPIVSVSEEMNVIFLRVILLLGLRWERDETMQTMVLVLLNQHNYYYDN
jgi:hypothetical protein